ncbi:MAG TPA: hypothetical protein VGP93_19885, partial [Polyangiaceae bacterium]|nr:hypothetical protein [Polyangiaceae bacterium]
MKACFRWICFCCALWPVSLACAKRADPPGFERAATSAVRSVGEGAPAVATGSSIAAKPGGPHAEPGSLDDNLPFAPTGLKLASTALRTWIYTDVGPKRTRYGDLRAGAIVDARGPAIQNEGCDGGWYRVNPRGFVCVGMGATLDLQ